MANRLLKPIAGSLEAGITKLYGHVVTSSAGAIASQDCKGFSVELTASEAGRYTVTLEDSWVALRACSVSLVGSADTGYVSGKGLANFLRNVDVVTAKSFDIQFADEADPQADADVEDGAEFYIEITLKNSSAY